MQNFLLILPIPPMENPIMISRLIPFDLLKEEYKLLDDETIQSLDVVVEKHLVRFQSLWSELCYILLKSKRKVSYDDKYWKSSF